MPPILLLTSQTVRKKHQALNSFALIPTPLTTFVPAAGGASFKASNAKWPPATGLAMNCQSGQLHSVSSTPRIASAKGGGRAYPPVWVLYRSVKARLVVVVSIQFASLDINIDFVEGEEMAATHIPQSAAKEGLVP